MPHSARAVGAFNNVAIKIIDTYRDFVYKMTNYSCLNAHCTLSITSPQLSSNGARNGFCHLTCCRSLPTSLARFKLFHKSTRGAAIVKSSGGLSDSLAKRFSQLKCRQKSRRFSGKSGNHKNIINKGTEHRRKKSFPDDVDQ
jgi:hypothetical protein